MIDESKELNCQERGGGVVGRRIQCLLHEANRIDEMPGGKGETGQESRILCFPMLQ